MTLKPLCVMLVFLKDSSVDAQTLHHNTQFHAVDSVDLTYSRDRNMPTCSVKDRKKHLYYTIYKQLVVVLNCQILQQTCI